MLDRPCKHSYAFTAIFLDKLTKGLLIVTPFQMTRFSRTFHLVFKRRFVTQPHPVDQKSSQVKSKKGIDRLSRLIEWPSDSKIIKLATHSITKFENTYLHIIRYFLLYKPTRKYFCKMQVAFSRSLEIFSNLSFMLWYRVSHSEMVIYR